MKGVPYLASLGQPDFAFEDIPDLSPFRRLQGAGASTPGAAIFAGLSDVDTKHVWNPQEGQAFLANLFLGAEQLVQAQHGWEHISKSAARLKIRPAEIIRAIQDKRLMSIGKHADFDGYAALYVYHDQVAALLGG